MEPLIQVAPAPLMPKLAPRMTHTQAMRRAALVALVRSLEPAQWRQAQAAKAERLARSGDAEGAIDAARAARGKHER